MEKWLANKGLRAKDIATLFRDAEKTGEAALTVSRLHEGASPWQHGEYTGCGLGE